MAEVLNWRGFSFTIFIIRYSYLLHFTDYLSLYLRVSHVSGRIAQCSSIPLDIAWYWVRTMTSSDVFWRVLIFFFEFIWKHLKTSKIFCLAYFSNDLNWSKFILTLILRSCSFWSKTYFRWTCCLSSIWLECIFNFFFWKNCFICWNISFLVFVFADWIFV